MKKTVITNKEIKTLAELNFLKLSKEELEKMKGGLEDTLNNLLEDFDVEKIKKIPGKIAVKSVNFEDLRRDEIKTSLDVKDVLQNSQNVYEDYFSVPKIL